MTDTVRQGKQWNLVADIGGTNARFGLAEQASHQLLETFNYPVAEHQAFTDALQHLLDDVALLGGWEPLPRSACFAVACAVEGDRVQFTNSPWMIDRQDLCEHLATEQLALINDFAAVGYAINGLSSQDWMALGGGAPDSKRPSVVLGPGTGLGVCTLVPTGNGYHVIEGEGGHISFAPVNPQEITVLEILGKRFDRVSVERLLSGAGILNIYQALAELNGECPQYSDPADITRTALEGNDPLSANTLSMFFDVLGSVAGDLCLALGAKGGVYIAGGIVPRLLGAISESGFRRRFENKGRFSTYMADIPVRVVTRENLGLIGAIRKLQLAE